MIEQKYHKVEICNGIQLHRFYLGSSPDECGTVSDYHTALAPMFDAVPFRPYWEGLDVRGWHMDSPTLEDESRRLIANLQDYDTSRPGYQVAAGLYWNKDRMDIGFFPDFWRPEDAPQVRPIAVSKRAQAIMVLSHELGHFHADQCGFGKTSTLIQREITRLFGELAAALGGQATNPGELWAEVYRAFFGSPGARGFFSDGKPYRESDNPRLYTLMRCAYWLQSWLAQVDFSDLKAYPDCIMWQQWKMVPVGWWFERRPDAVYKVDRNWNRFKWWYDSAGRWDWYPA